MNSSTIINKKGLWIACIILSIFTFSFSGMILKTRELKEPENLINLDSLPENFGNWSRGQELGLDIRSLDVLRLTSYVKRSYVNNEGKTLYLYIGYWASQTGEHQAAKHSPVLCLPSNGWITSNRENFEHSFKFNNSDVSINIRRILGELRGRSTLFYYWFFTGEEYYNQEWYALIKLSLQNLFYGRNDGGIIEIAAELPRDKSKKEAELEANLLIQDFLKELAPYLHKEIKN